MERHNLYEHNKKIALLVSWIIFILLPDFKIFSFLHYLDDNNLTKTPNQTTLLLSNYFWKNGCKLCKENFMFRMFLFDIFHVRVSYSVSFS